MPETVRVFVPGVRVAALNPTFSADTDPVPVQYINMVPFALSAEPTTSMTIRELFSMLNVRLLAMSKVLLFPKQLDKPHKQGYRKMKHL